MSIETSYDLSRINQKRPDNMLVQLNKMQAQIEEMYAAIAAGANSHTSDTDNPHSVTASQVGLGNVDNYDTATQSEAEAGTATDKFMTPQRSKQAIDKQIKGTSWIQENGLYIATDQLRARDSSGLILSDDSGNGLTILDGGNTSLTAGKYHSADSIRARDSGGLGLYDDAGQGLLINDGGIVTNSYQPSFSAYVNITQENVTGDGTSYNLTGSFFTEIHDNGSNFSNGIFTAPVTSNKYKFGVTLDFVGISSSHTYARLYLKTSNLGNRLVALCNPYAASYGGVWAETYIISDVEMDINDTANFYFDISNGTKVIDVFATNTRIWGGLE